VVAFMVEFVGWVRGLFWAYVGVIVEVVVGFGRLVVMALVMTLVMALVGGRASSRNQRSTQRGKP